MLKKSNRITNSGLITLLFKKGNVCKSKAFMIRFLPSLHQQNQFVIIVSKKVAKSAVDRNHIKRQMSEAIRLKLDQFKSPIVASVLIKPSFTPHRYADFERGIEEFIKTLNNKS